MLDRIEKTRRSVPVRAVLLAFVAASILFCLSSTTTSRELSTHSLLRRGFGPNVPIQEEEASRRFVGDEDLHDWSDPDEVAGLAPTPTSPPELRERQLSLPSISLPNPFAAPTGGSSSSGGSSAAGGLGGIFTDLGNAISGLGTALIGDLNGPSLVLGLGIGSGTATGLNFTTADKAAPVVSRLQQEYNVSGGVNNLVLNIGEGAASAVVSLVDPTSVLNGTALNATSLQPYALNLGQGIGNGTASGLDLSERAAKMVPPDATDLPGLLGTLTFALSKSLTENTDVNHLNFDPALIQKIAPILPPAGLGLGQGIGVGGQVVLKLQTDDQMTSNWGKVSSPGIFDVKSITGSFSMGLVSSFFANVTLSDIMDKTINTNTGLTDKIKLGPMAQGFARGLVQGVGDAINEYGGFQAIANNTAPMKIAIPNSTVPFNDSLYGGATGFGQGLGGQTVILVREWIGGARTNGTAGVANIATLGTRQESPAVTTDNGSPQVNLSQLLSDSELSILSQKGVDALTCTGVGGVIGIFVGLFESGTITKDTLSQLNLSLVTNNMFPNGTIRITSDGNIFEFDTSALNEGTYSALVGGVKVNGFSVIAFAVFLGFHIVLGIIVFATVFPSSFIIETSQGLLMSLGSVGLPAWLTELVRLNWILFGPMLFLMFLFGVLAAGSAKHFHTAHGVLGLLTTLLAIPTVVLWFMARKSMMKREKELDDVPPSKPTGFTVEEASRFSQYALLVMSLPTLITGFGDLSSASMCATSVANAAIWIAIGVLVVGGTWSIAVAMAGLDLLSRRFSVRQVKDPLDAEKADSVLVQRTLMEDQARYASDSDKDRILVKNIHRTLRADKRAKEKKDKGKGKEKERPKITLVGPKSPKKDSFWKKADAGQYSEI